MGVDLRLVDESLSEELVLGPMFAPAVPGTETSMYRSAGTASGCVTSNQATYAGSYRSYPSSNLHVYCSTCAVVKVSPSWQLSDELWSPLSPLPLRYPFSPAFTPLP